MRKILTLKDQFQIEQKYEETFQKLNGNQDSMKRNL